MKDPMETTVGELARMSDEEAEAVLRILEPKLADLARRMRSTLKIAMAVIKERHDNQ